MGNEVWVRATFKKGLVLAEEEAPPWAVVKEHYFLQAAYAATFTRRVVTTLAL